MARCGRATPACWKAQSTSVPNSHLTQLETVNKCIGYILCMLVSLSTAAAGHSMFKRVRSRSHATKTRLWRGLGACQLPTPTKDVEHTQ